MSDPRPTATPDRGSAGPGGKRGLARLGLFYRQVVAELRKVIYPTRKELLTYFTVVLIFVGILITYVALLDFGFSELILGVFG